MSEWKAVGSESMLADGAMIEVSVDDRPILVSKVAGKYYATEGRCPHVGAKLAGGTLAGTVVKCPLHGSEFDVTTGACLVWAPRLPGPGRAVTNLWSKQRPLRVYPTRVQDGQVWVEVG